MGRKETRWIVRGIRLSALKNFIDHVVSDASNELGRIEQRRLEGEFQTFEDYESAESPPISRIKIGSRAVGQELVSFVESELHAVAWAAWLQSIQKGPKTLFELGENEGLRKLRMVSDLNISEVVGLIDKYYGLSVEKIEGWDDINRLRDAVNAFKHRDGARHWRDCGWGEKGFGVPQFEEITLPQAYDAMKTVERFLLALDGAIESSNKGI